MKDLQYYNLIDQIRKISLKYKQIISETNSIIYSQIREYNFCQLKFGENKIKLIKYDKRINRSN